MKNNKQSKCVRHLINSSLVNVVGWNLPIMKTIKIQVANLMQNPIQLNVRLSTDTLFRIYFIILIHK